VQKAKGNRDTSEKVANAQVEKAKVESKSNNEINKNKGQLIITYLRSNYPVVRAVFLFVGLNPFAEAQFYPII